MRKMPENPYTIKFSTFERMKYDRFVKDSEFKNLAELIRESLNVYISNPDARNPVKEKPSDSAIREGYAIYMDRKELEEKKILNAVVDNHNQVKTLERLVKLLLKDSGVSQRDIKQAERKDTSKEDIFDD